ncbi:MAG: FAD-binding oxidoreductase [Trebonia sp.]
MPVGGTSADRLSSAAGELSRCMRGPVFVPGDGDYDAERNGFQTIRRHAPGVIAGVAESADVRAAVQFAATHGLSVAVQGTGHGLALPATGGVLISTRRMTEVRVQPATRTARIGAGVRWDQVISEAAPYGLAPLSGSAPHVGAVSYTLGGGLGPIARSFGYAADYVRSIDIVTADGRLRRVSAQQDHDLFWALRGGRGNFGVATQIEIDLLPVARLFGGALFFDASLAADVLHGWLQWTATAPAELTSSVALVPFPDSPAVPPPLRGRHVAHIRIAYIGDAAAGHELVAPLRSIGPRLIDTVRQMPYTEVGSIHGDPIQPMAFRTTNVMLRDFTIPAVQTLLERARPGRKEPVIIELRHLGGALAGPPAIANAVGHRAARYLLIVLSRLSPSDDGAHIDAVSSDHERFLHEFNALTIGRCLNFMQGDHSADQVRTAYDPADYKKLVKLKSLYDPANIFRHDHNIQPVA